MRAHHSTDSHPALGVSDFSYPDLHDPQALARLYERFNAGVEADDPTLWSQWTAYRANPSAPPPPTELSELLVKMAPHVSRFVTRLFQIEPDVDALTRATADVDPLFRFKELVRRRALPLRKGGAKVVLDEHDVAAVDALVKPYLAPGRDLEMSLALAACDLLDLEAAGTKSPFFQNHSGKNVPERGGIAETINSLKRWCAAHLEDRAYRGWVSFRFPHTLDYFHLVEVVHPEPGLPEAMQGPEEELRKRDGFGLTDHRMNQREVLSEIHYCVLCHERDKDTCSKGIFNDDGKVRPNPLGIPLTGCPLDEKISEMHLMRKRGDAIAALALVTIDNPMCPGTGHRICNDCMKSCIYQKQDPVNIPQIETGVLTDVLRLPWGVEIYGLFTRWNPLNVTRPYALPYNGRNVLVVGLGPAGYTLAHYLVNEGFGVVGIDGLKIEPLPDDIVGLSGQAPRAIRNWSEIYRPLDERILEGFGGVSEYGITVRWDKNFLTLLHLTLARRSLLRIFGGVRFGGTVTADDACSYGFDHIAIAAGAGKPTIIDIKNNLIRGIRKASDFLMALQLTGAFKKNALASLQMRLPAIVIGGGLTGIDTATELFAYYPIQVEKTLQRYETLVAELGEARVRGMYDPEESALLDEFLAHGHEVRAERARAAAAGVPPDFVELVRSWGGVSLVYRKRMVDAPAYRLNHEEVEKSLEEGITFIENMNPYAAIPDENGHIRSMQFVRTTATESDPPRPEDIVTLPARTVLVAAGTTPNITYEREHPSSFKMDKRGKFFQPHKIVQNGAGYHPEPAEGGFFTSYNKDGRLITFYGDNHPTYAGNVVKAMASARDGYREIVKLFAAERDRLNAADQPSRDAAWDRLVTLLDDDLIPRVTKVERLTSTIIEVVVRAPAAARGFHPGQFYRLQNYESYSPVIQDNGPVPLLMEGVALTGAWVDREQGLLSMIALELGVSSRLCSLLTPGEPVVVMGPTGTPTEIPEGQNVLLAGGGLGNAVLFSIAKALRDEGNRVIYFAGYKKGEDLFKREEIEEGTDQVIWSTDTGDTIQPGRPQDSHFRGNIVQAMVAYAEGKLGPVLVPLHTVHRIIAIGSDRMMAAVKASRHGILAPLLNPNHVAIASINSPMQCMMKEVCAQCLQKHVDPATGKESIIFSCFNQDQEMDRVDFPNLAARLRQNTVQEKLSNLWFMAAMDRRAASPELSGQPAATS